MNTLKNSKGFSLVELMVVVAIIGILATVAVPNFLKFQAKARQANAKSELSGIYTVEKIYYAENGFYQSNITFLGYVPDGIPLLASSNCPDPDKSKWPGNRYYHSGFGGWTGVAARSNVSFRCDEIIGGDQGTESCYEATTGSQSLLEGTSCAKYLFSNDTPFNGYRTFMANPDSFNAGAVGQVSGSALDMWEITDKKVLTSVISGI